QSIRRRKFASVPPIFHSEMLQRLGWAAFPFSQRFVSEILQILDPHLACPEAARRQITEAAEEGRAMRKRRFDRPWICKVIQHLPPLGVGAFDERLVEPRVAQMIDER